MARIYTRSGDRGETALGDGSRVTKSAPRVDLYGEVDELISWIGHVGALLDADGRSDATAAAISSDLIRIQNRLFCLASVTANPALAAEDSTRGARHPAFDARHLEERIDEMDGMLPPLAHFILPDGPPSVTALHLARTVCRRVERKAVDLSVSGPFPDRGIEYLNRLSDYLFTAARAINHAAGHEDRVWDQTEGLDA